MVEGFSYSLTFVMAQTFLPFTDHDVTHHVAEGRSEPQRAPKQDNSDFSKNSFVSSSFDRKIRFLLFLFQALIEHLSVSRFSG